MKSAYPFFFLIMILFLSGCVTEKIRASGTPAGQLLCEDSNCVLSYKLRQWIKCREKAYHAMNQVDYGDLHFDCKLPEETYKEILELRWILARSNQKNEALIDELKEILRRDPCDQIDLIFENPSEQTEYEEIADLMLKIHEEHNSFMENYETLKELIKPYKPSFFKKIFLI